MKTSKFARGTGCHLAAAALAVALVLIACAPARAEEQGDTPARWHFKFTPYVWAAGLSGDVGVGKLSVTGVEASSMSGSG